MNVDIWSKKSINIAKGTELHIIKEHLGIKAFRKFCKKKGIGDCYANRLIKMAKS